LLSSLFSEHAVATPAQSTQELAAKMVGGSVEYWAQESEELTDPTTPDFWTKKRISSSKILCGIRGSGKSVLSEYCASMLLDGTDLLISDRHYDQQESKWLKGMDRDAFEKQMLLDTARKTYLSLLKYGRTLRARIDSGDKSATPIHMLIDEWGGCWREWDEDTQAEIIKTLEFINEEGRKYGVNVTLVLHQLTEKKTGLGESLTSAADLYLLGDAISATTYTYPASLSAQRKELMAARRKALSQVKVPQRVVIYREALTGEATVIFTPDLSQPLDISVETSKSMEDIWEPGISARSMSEAMGVTNRKKENPEYQAILDFLQTKEGELDEAT